VILSSPSAGPYSGRSAGPVLLILLALLLASCSGLSEDESGPAGAITSSVETVQLTVPGAPAGSTVIEGMIDAHEYVEFSFARSGTIVELGAQLGDRVRRGQFMGMLESESLQEKLTEAKTQRARARRSLPSSRLSRGGPPPAYLERSARARRGAISSQVAMQDADLRRLRRAVEDGGQEEATRVAISILHQRNRQPSNRSAERLAQDRLTQRLYEDLVDKVRTLDQSIKASRLLSPVDGLVVEVNAYVGETWNPRSQVSTYKLMDDRRLVVWLLAPEGLVSRLQADSSVLVWFPDKGGAPVEGRVGEISGVQIESVSDEGELELFRQLRIILPSRLPSGLGVADDALVAFPR